MSSSIPYIPSEVDEEVVAKNEAEEDVDDDWRKMVILHRFPKLTHTFSLMTKMTLTLTMKKMT